MSVGAGTALRLRRCRVPRMLRSLLGCLGILALTGAPAGAARLISASGSQADAYGRIILTFDVPLTVTGKMSGSVLILTYGEAVTGSGDKIAAGVPSYVSVVRRDPDGTAMRLALQRPYRLNVQQAGEKVFVDLLPQSWAGLPPPLPQDVVAELGRRAREAEAALRARTAAPAPVALPLELALQSNRTRLSLKLPPEARSVFQDADGTTRLTLPPKCRL